MRYRTLVATLITVLLLLSLTPTMELGPAAIAAPNTSLAGNWVDNNGVVIGFVGGPTTFTGEVVTNTANFYCLPLNVNVTETAAGQFEGTVAIYSPCGTFVNQGMITIDIAADGNTAQVTTANPDGGCGNCGTFTWTRAGPQLAVSAGPDQTVIGTNIVSLNGQVTGTVTSTVWSQVSGPGTVVFSATNTVSSNATVSTPGTYTLELTASGGGQSAGAQVNISVLSYVALGDSYSAGPGADGPYSGGNCYRSPNAYPVLVDDYLAAPNPVPAGTPNPAFVFGACSAANTTSLSSLTPPASSQLPYLESRPAGTVGRVSFTIGANDGSTFGNVISYCALRLQFQQSCKDHSLDAVAQLLGGIGTTLTAVYAQIKNIKSIVDGGNVLAPNAQLLVLGYPKLFPTGQAYPCPTGFLTFDFLPSDMAWINYVIQEFDTRIQAATAAMPGVTYVNTYNAFDGHELCQSGSLLNAFTFAPGVSAAGAYHPNKEGQAVLATFAEGRGVNPPLAAPAFTSRTPPLNLLLPGEIYSHLFPASGNPTPTFRVTSGTLPNGLTLDPTIGLLAGAVTKAGTFSFEITAKNSSGSVTSSMTITVL